MRVVKLVVFAFLASFALINATSFIFVFVPAARTEVELIEKIRVVDVKLEGRDPNNWTSNFHQSLWKWRKEHHTIFFVQIFDVEGELAVFDHFIVEVILSCHRSKFWAWKGRERTQVEAIYC
jgi:hypothetical protein